MKEKEFDELYGRYLDVSSVEDKALDISYGPYERNQLDIYYPEKGQAPYPVIVFYHGGGFFKGDKRRYQLKPALAGLEYGYAVVSVNYRLIQTDSLPAAIWDAKAAVRFLKGNASALRLDPDRMAVWGESAGAMLACEVGLTEGVPDLQDLTMGNPEQSTQVRAVIDWYAPVDMKEMEQARRQSGDSGMEIGGRPLNLFSFDRDGTKSEEEIYTCMDKINPLNYLGKTDSSLPAFLIEHGGEDKLVSPEQSKRLYKALQNYLPPERLVYRVIPAAVHGVEDFTNEENLEFIFSYLENWMK